MVFISYKGSNASLLLYILAMKYKRPELAHEMVSDMINKFALQQIDIAKFCGISQPAINAMLNGGGAKRSTEEKLIKLYNQEFPKYKKRILKAAETF